MRLIFKRGRPTNPSGLTMAWSICYSAAAEMELNKPKKCEQANKSVSTTEGSNGNVTFSCDQQSAEVRFYVLLSTIVLHDEITVMCVTHGFMDGLHNNVFTNPIISSYLVHKIHFPLDFHFLSQFIVAMFTGLMAYVMYCPFYHLATMHVCKTVGIY